MAEVQKLNATEQSNVNQFNGALLLEILHAVATYGPQVVTLIRQLIDAFKSGKTPVVFAQEDQQAPK